MRLDSKEIGWLAMGAAFVFLLAYIAYDKSDTGQPRFANSTLATAGFNAVESTIADLDTGDHYFHPAYCVPGQTQIFTAHRYPAVSGGSISTLFHHGMDRLAKPAPQDDDWIKRPPGEVMWLCRNPRKSPRHNGQAGMCLRVSLARCHCGPGWE